MKTFSIKKMRGSKPGITKWAFRANTGRTIGKSRSTKFEGVIVRNANANSVSVYNSPDTSSGRIYSTGNGVNNTQAGQAIYSAFLQKA